MDVSERYTPVVAAVNSTTPIAGNKIGGFLCITSGTVTVVANGPGVGVTTTIVNALPVTAGVYYRLPFYLSINGGTFTTAGGASGTIAI